MRNVQNKRRINVQIPESLSKRFKNIATRAGISRAKLIRKWLNEPLNLQLIQTPYNKEKNVTFHFYLSTDEHNYLVKESVLYGIQCATFLRILITNYVQKSFNIQSITSNITSEDFLSDLITRGDLGHAHDLANNLIKQEEIPNLLRLAKVKIELSRHDAAEKILKRIRLNKPSQEIASEANILESQIELDRRKLRKVKELSLAKPFSGQLRAEQLLQLGVVNALEGSTTNAEKLFIEATDIGEITDTYTQFKGYMYLIYIYLRTEELEKAKEIARLSSSLVDKLNNKHVLAWYNVSLGRIESIAGNITASDIYLKNGLAIHNGEAMHKGITESSGSLSLNCLALLDYANAEKQINLSQKHETYFRTASSDGLSNLIQLFINTKAAYKTHIVEMEKLTNSTRHIKTPIKEYLLASAYYLHADIRIDQEKGIRDLKRISLEGAYKQIQSAAINTIKYKRLTPFAL